MPAQMVSGDVDGVDFRADPRNEARLVVEVETDTVGGISVGGQMVWLDYPKNGERVEPQKRRVVIYESQWPAVQAMVRTDKHTTALERSREKNRQAIERSLKAARNEKDRQRILDAHEDITWAELAKEPGCETGIPVLLSAVVVQRNVAPPPTTENLLANQHGDLAAVLRTMLEELRAPSGGRGKGERAAG